MNVRAIKALCRRLTLLGALSAAALPLGAQSSDPRFDAARDTIRAIMEANNVPSISVAIARGDRILWEESFGYADKERAIRATPRTMYSLASISKPITATGLMILVERGKVDVDRPANRYLGAAKLRAFEGSADAATVRRLLTHTAGLPLHYQFFYAGGPPPHSMDTAIARYGVLVYPPGERYFYSNLGYGILDHIIARTSGMSYSDFMRSEVFAPLGFPDMTVSDGAGLGERAAVRYDNEGQLIPPYTFDHVGASGVYASAHDLVRFGQWHLGVALQGATDVLSPQTRARMQASDASAGEAGVARGWGWGIAEDDHGLRRISHGGGMPGVATVLMLYPAESLSVVVLANTSAVPTARIAAAMTAAVVPRYARERDARAERARQALAAQATGSSASAAADSVPRPAALVGRWSGMVLVPGDPVPLTFDIPVRGAARVRVGSQPETELAVRIQDADSGQLTARFEAEILGADAAGPEARGLHTVAITLRLRGNALSGWASVLTTRELSYGAVSYRVEMAPRE
ncbi:MAG TPA: serine hydrolase domain-containing protein [Gemmatimonadaceae bacterium]|nr:serine hydrolase domain-containing protein [Gemmatimonadaceae bacterium]